MGILDNLYKHSMVHPIVADAYLTGKDVPESILQNEVPNPEFLEAIGEIGAKYANIVIVQTDHGIVTADSNKITIPGKVTLTATPNEGYYTSKWQILDGDNWIDINVEGVSTSENENSVTLEYDITEQGTYNFRALFEEDTILVTVTFAEINGGYSDFQLNGQPVTEGQNELHCHVEDIISITAPEQVEWLEGGPGAYLYRHIEYEGVTSLGDGEYKVLAGSENYYISIQYTSVQ